MPKTPKHRVYIMSSVKLASGEWRYRHPAVAKNGRIRPFYAVIDGEAAYHPEANYVLQYRENGKLRYEPLGTSDPAELAAAQKRKELLLQANADGLVVLGPEPAPKPKRARETTSFVSAPATSPTPDASAAKGKPSMTAKTAIDTFLDEKCRFRKPKTYEAYRAILIPFRKFLHERREHLEEVAREDMLDFLHLLSAVQENAPRTVCNKHDRIRQMFSHYKIAWPMFKTDRPRYTQKLVTVYKERELKALFEAATLEEGLLFNFFLATGGRDQDVQHATWADIDFDESAFLIQEKQERRPPAAAEQPMGRRPRHGSYEPKDKEEAGIPIPPDLSALLKQRRERYPGSHYLFPAPNGGPDRHFLRYLKDLAFRASLNCGYCYRVDKNGKEHSCAKEAMCYKWTLHKFRRTFATRHHRNGTDARTIQKWLRHSDLETTLRYLAAIDDMDDETRQRVNETFALFVGLIKRTAA